MEDNASKVRVVISTEGERVAENSLEEREGFTQVLWWQWWKCLFQPILISFHIIFCVQLLKSGEVEVVERGEVGISLTGVRLTLDIIIKDMAWNVFFWHLYSDYCEFFAQNSRLYSHVRPSVCMHVVTDVTSLR